MKDRLKSLPAEFTLPVPGKKGSIRLMVEDIISRYGPIDCDGVAAMLPSLSREQVMRAIYRMRNEDKLAVWSHGEKRGVTATKQPYLYVIPGTEGAEQVKASAGPVNSVFGLGGTA